MDKSIIISKVNEFLFRLNSQLITWLEKRLPKITDSWWDDLVLENLSTLQLENVRKKNIREIKGLDLAANLRIIDRNWFVLSDFYNLTQMEHENVREMAQIRNFWAHIAPEEITKQIVLHDTKIIIGVLQTFDAPITSTNDIETFTVDVEEDREIQQVPVKKSSVIPSNHLANENLQDDVIKVGSLVILKSDSSKIGAVIGINGTQYSVLIDNNIETLFKDQIELKDRKDTTSSVVPLYKVKAELTAYSVNNPGSSNLYSLNSARIDFVPYQFRPAFKLIKSDVPRILVADDVGVGKTIEAGLILKELEARSQISSVLIICPRPLVAERKWVTEMKRFDENFTQLDGRMFSEILDEANRDDGEWPDQYKKIIIPYSIFNEDSVNGHASESKKKHKGTGLSELTRLPQFDLVIVDEAHTIRNSNTWAYKAVELFCREAASVVFLTATPLQNSNKDLYTLLNLLRPDLITDKNTFNKMSEPNTYINKMLKVIRRQDNGWQTEAKKELTNVLSTGWGINVIQHNPNFGRIHQMIDQESLTRDEKVSLISMVEGLHSFDSIINRTRRKDIDNFCIRRNNTVRSDFTLEQKAIYDALISFEAQALGYIYGNANVRFMMCTIMRQASSCIYGLAPFVHDLLSKRMTQLGDADFLEEETDSELNDGDIDILRKLALQLDTLVKHLPSEDPKIQKLSEIIDQKQHDENNRVIIFSSFRHTLHYIFKHLEDKGYRVAQVDGSVSDEERYAIRERFMLDRENPNAIDVLLFSEVGCEGLDYQFCDTMVNYDLPWNPMRIEQRIGRIDRKGQKSPMVKIYNMITTDTIDAVIYDRCLSKIGVFEDSIGDCSEILGDISDQIFAIMFEPNLTDDERKLKIEKMADNDVMRVQEMQKLEKEDKDLYGFDLSNYVIDSSVQNATDQWVSPEKLRALVNTYLEDILGSGEYIIGKEAGKTLRLAAEKRDVLLKDLGKLNIQNKNMAYKQWRNYLKSTKPTLEITFDNEYAKNHRTTAYITQMHPLVLQAAAHEKEDNARELCLKLHTDEIPSGRYAFLVYSWNYTGLKPDKKLVTICNDQKVEDKILPLLDYCTEASPNIPDRDEWDQLEKSSYHRWQKAQQEYKKEREEDSNYKIERLEHSLFTRTSIIQNQLDSTTDDKIRRMREAQIENLKNEYNRQETQIRESVKEADIRVNLLIKGFLTVSL